jgi:hypothetical protein
VSNPAIATRADGDPEIVQYYDQAAKNFSDSCKKTLAFFFGLGVASASVQGLKVAPCSSDGEAGVIFGGWFGAIQATM